MILKQILIATGVISVVIYISINMYIESIVRKYNTMIEGLQIDLEICKKNLTKAVEDKLALELEIKRKSHLLDLRNNNIEKEIELKTFELTRYNRQLEQYAITTGLYLNSSISNMLEGINKLELEDDPYHVFKNKTIICIKELSTVSKDINQILEIIRKQMNHQVIHLDLQDCLESVEISLKEKIKSTKAIIIKNFSKIRVVRTVGPLLTNIFMELITNSIRYKHPDRYPIIKIESSSNQNFVILRFSDNGIGFDPELYKDKIFGLYQTLHSNFVEKGTGLFLVKSQLDLIGGKIECESKVDKGSIFTIYLPLKV